jgi:hypothetical protein
LAKEAVDGKVRIDNRRGKNTGWFDGICGECFCAGRYVVIRPPGIHRVCGSAGRVPGVECIVVEIIVGIVVIPRPAIAIIVTAYLRYLRRISGRPGPDREVDFPGTLRASSGEKRAKFRKLLSLAFRWGGFGFGWMICFHRVKGPFECGFRVGGLPATDLEEVFWGWMIRAAFLA